MSLLFFAPIPLAPFPTGKGEKLIKSIFNPPALSPLMGKGLEKPTPSFLSLLWRVSAAAIQSILPPLPVCSAIYSHFKEQADILPRQFYQRTKLLPLVSGCSIICYYSDLTVYLIPTDVVKVVFDELAV